MLLKSLLPATSAQPDKTQTVLQFSGPKSSQLFIITAISRLARLNISNLGWLWPDSWLICSKHCLYLTRPNGVVLFLGLVGLKVMLSSSTPKATLESSWTWGLCCIPCAAFFCFMGKQFQHNKNQSISHIGFVT